ncbi:hypothetical protein FIBSPDRAFT_877015 [Athelia psychrophila]|uniref:Uncharacterized protein n=1 Tax=Athelia psychrophila TaxID=1759441 RepID=A0A167WC10_9AGAM|nr:hypothetical protein FIBSPDRAFT_877015 [Fibularhizoctonia sp. CBS 109695]
MHFSALTVLACALVAVNVTARPVDNVISAVVPVAITNAVNGNVVKVANGVLSKRDGLVDIDAATKVTNVLNGNVIKAGNHILRDVVNVVAPVTIEEIFDCNTIEVANNILNNLAAELGCLVIELGIAVQDILDCNPGNWHTLVDALYAHVGKPTGLGKRGDLVTAIAPITVAYAVNHNDVKAANHVLRDAVDVAIPVTIEEIFDCNDISIANNILNNLAAELGCTIAFLGITVEDILACNPGNWHTLVDELYAHVGKPTGLAKRDDAITDPNPTLLGLLGIVIGDVQGLGGPTA